MDDEPAQVQTHKESSMHGKVKLVTTKRQKPSTHRCKVTKTKHNMYTKSGNATKKVSQTMRKKLKITQISREMKSNGKETQKHTTT